MHPCQEAVAVQHGSFHTFSFVPWPQVNSRQRRKHHKTFTACVVCKKSRIRCTEEKPSCVRCIRIKADCYYQPPKAWIFEPTSTIDNAPPTSAQTPTLSLQPLQSRNDRRALSYYQQRVCPIYSCFFGKDFWSTIVLQMSHQHDVIRDALVGAAALFESVEVRNHDQATKLQAKFFLKYGSAMKAIASGSGEAGVQLTLAACAMFANFEMIMGSIERSKAHAQAGMKIYENHLHWLQKCGKANSEEAFLLETRIEPILAGHVLQAHVYGASPISTYEISQVISEHYQLPCIPVFSHILEAYQSLVGILQYGSVIDTAADTTWVRTNLDRLEVRLHEWTQSFHQFAKELNPTERQIQTLNLFILRCNISLAWIRWHGLQYAQSLSDHSRQSHANFDQALLQRYNEIESRVRGIRESSSNSEAFGYRPLFTIITVTPTAEDNDRARELHGRHRKSDDEVWSYHRALSVANAIIQRSTAVPALSSDTQASPIINDDSTAIDEPELDMIRSVDIFPLTQPQQLSVFGILLPRLPASLVTSFNSNNYKD